MCIDCEFVCPYDDGHDLTDYHIMNRIMSSVYDDTLQQEVLQKHETLNTVDLLVKYCENFETTKKDRARLKSNTDSNISAVRFNEELTEEVVAAVTAYKRQKQQFIPKNTINKTEEMWGTVDISIGIKISLVLQPINSA